MPRARNPYQQIVKSFLSAGAVGWVYQIDNEIVLKYPRDNKSNEFIHEKDIYDKFENHHKLCPHIARSFYRTETCIFLQYYPNGTFLDRLHNNQTREKNSLISVNRLEDRRLIERWAAELCGASAWLEAQGLVHGDLRPANMLLDGQDHLKLSDFDSVACIVENALGSAPPWARLRPESNVGSYGQYGPETEQFAIGSVIYYLTRGYEPYGGPDHSHWVAGTATDLWRSQIFPEVQEDDALERVALNCWGGTFATLECLKETTMTLPGSRDMAGAADWTTEYRFKMRQKCEGLLSKVSRSEE